MRIRLRRIWLLVIHNWPLKVAAIVVATLLYAGLVLSENAQRWDGQVAIQAKNVPADAVLVSDPGNVTEIRFFAPGDVAARVSNQTFQAFVDLSNVNASAPSALVPVQVEPTDARITIVDFQPTQVRVELDPLVERSVPVRVDRGEVPQGLQVGDPQLSTTTVTAVGPASVVKRVAYALARVTIQANALSIDEDVSLVAVDAFENRVTPVDLRPDSVHVRISVGSNAGTRSLPVNPVVTGSPASGYIVQATRVEPAVVTVSGDAATLGTLDTADTAPVSIAGATADVAATVPLALPTDVTPVGVKEVTVTITIQPLAGSRTFSAGIVLAGARDDRTYALSTDSVNVTIGGSLAALDKLDPASFTVTADVSALAPGSHTVTLSLNLPAGLTVSGISPPQVGVVVAAAASPSPSPSASPSPSPS